jgi:hypothetical protein
MSERMRLLRLLRERHDLLRDVRDALRRLDPAWCVLHGKEQLADEELEELIGRVEDAVEDGDGTPS